MNPEETVTEPQNPAEEVVEVGDDKKSDDSSDGDKDPKAKPWFQKRFDRFTAQNQNLARENQNLSETNAQLLEEMANLKAGKTEEGGKSTFSDAEIDRRVTAKALEIAAVKEFNDKCNTVHDKGLKEFDDFEDSVKTLTSMGVMTPDFLETVTDLDNSHKILHYLGQNPEEADRIQGLSPTKRALALAKLETKVDERPSKEISKAPAPIKPIKGKTASSEGYGNKYYDGMPHDEYESWRSKSAKK